MIRFYCPNPKYKPTRPYEDSAGFDLLTVGDHELPLMVPKLLPTGVHVEIPNGYAGIYRERSGTHKHRVLPLAGTIESDYRGQLFVVVMYYGMFDSEQNPIGPTTLKVADGTRFVQLVVVKKETEHEFVDSLDKLSSTERGERGFGSTGR